MTSEEDSVADVIEWIAEMARRGLYPQNSARFRASALRNLTSILGPNEPRTATWTFDHLDEIVRRSARRKRQQPQTADTYKTRARTALADFLAYSQDPKSFQGRARGVPLPNVEGAVRGRQQAALQQYSLSNDRRFLYALPE